jgi:hypothetical protein
MRRPLLLKRLIKKENTMAFGTNSQHEAFRGKVKEERGKMDKPSSKSMGGEKPPMEGEGKTTTMTAHPDGHVEVEHADGEKSSHPTMGHAMMAIHAKHEPGPAHLMHDNGVGVTTHHVGHDGEPQGPDQHPDVEAAAEHAKMAMGGDGMSMENMGGDMPEGMPMPGGY